MATIIESWDADLLDTLTDAARWSRIAKVVDWPGQQLLFDDYHAKHGVKDAAFYLASTENAVEFLLSLYDFVANEAQRKSLRTFFRALLAFKIFREGGPLGEMVWPLKQRVDEYDFLAAHNCHPPDGGDDA